MSWLSSDTLNNVRIDSGHFGTAMLSAQLLSGKSVTDRDWLKSSLLTLVGFAVYQVLVKQLVKTDGVAHVNVRSALDDILKVGTMLVASRYLSGQPLNDPNWMKESAFILAGFVTYDLAVVHVADTSSLSKRHRMAADDVVKFSTMFVVSRWLAGQEFNMEWAKGCAYYIAGLVAYDMFLADA